MAETFSMQADGGAMTAGTCSLVSPCINGDGSYDCATTLPSSPPSPVAGPTPTLARYQTMLSFPFFRRSPPSFSGRPLSQKELEEAIQQCRSVRDQRNERMETQHTQAVMSKLRGVNRSGKATSPRMRGSSAGRRRESEQEWNADHDVKEQRCSRPFKQRVTSASSMSLNLPTYARIAPPVVTQRVVSGVRARKREPSETDVIVEYMVETFVRRHITLPDVDTLSRGKTKPIKGYGDLRVRIPNAQTGELEGEEETATIRPGFDQRASQRTLQTAPWEQIDAEAVHAAITQIENGIIYGGMGSPLTLVREVRVQIHSCVLTAMLSPGSQPSVRHPVLKVARISWLARAVQARDTAYRRIFIELVGVSPERWLEWLKFGAGEDDVRMIDRFAEG